MNSRLAAITLTAFLALAPAGLGSGKKEAKASISLHMQTEATDNPKMIFPQLTNGQTHYFRRMPEIGTKDVMAFSPFPSEFDGSYGIVFKLKGNAARRLAALTNANQGRWMVSQINGRVVDGVMIDRQVDDGVVVIWKGVTLADIAAFDEDFPRIGQEGQKKKK